MNNAAPRGSTKARTRGPVELALEIGFGLLAVTVFAWFMGLMIEILGSYTLWEDEKENHARSIVVQDLEYIALAPRSLLVRDTVGLSQQIIEWVHAPYQRLGVLRWYERNHSQAAATAEPTDTRPATLGTKGMRGVLSSMSSNGSRWALMSMFVAQDVLLRLSVAAFALPAFVLACMVGVVDGLVRRDLRRWGGGRESSFVYHHAKRYTHWALTGGFGLYLAWPFGGFNPSYMVLVFAILTAVALSTTVATFKKYV